MSAEGVRCNGEVKQEVLSSSEGLLTYQRRKRIKINGESSYPQEHVSVSADEQVICLASKQWKGKDFGWEHGGMINGNRYHWKCKYCNFVGRSGGVTRLKKHLAGGWHVRPCEKVPRHISNAMNTHLLELRKKRLFQRTRDWEQDDIDETNSGYPLWDVSDAEGHDQVGLSMQANGIEQSGTAGKSFEPNSLQSRDSYPCSKFAIQQLNSDVAKVTDCAQIYRKAGRSYRRTRRRSASAIQLYKTDISEDMKEANEVKMDTDVYEQSELAQPDNHWRSVLQHMLQFPDVREGGGIESSINNALTYGSPVDDGNHKMTDVPMGNDEPKDSHRTHLKVPGHWTDASADTQVDASEAGTCDRTDAIANKQKCKETLFNILRSEEFISLCNLLCENFQGIKVDKLFDICQINSKMKNGVYGQSPELFNQDLQQMWKKFQKIGEEMVLLVSSLSGMSQDTRQNQVEDDFIPDASWVQDTCLQKCEVNCQDGVVAKNSNDSDTGTQFPSCESVPSAKPDQSEASALYKICTCKQCGIEADGECSLICDECEAVYHFSCVEPAVQGIPSRSWYCAFCSKERTQSSEPPTKNTQEDSLHDNCVVCERLEFSDAKENPNDSGGTATANGSRESSVSSMESDEQPEPSRTALSRLCKQCGTCEDEDKRFLICGHSQCPYKYYHIRCLTTSQIASHQQAGQRCWYCPSCLCRACFCDRDDDLIVLCDNCDEAYHTYCMKPPRTSVPKGQWYCLKCNVAKAKEGMRRYEQWILQQHGKKDIRLANEGNRSMDVLLSAVEKLSSEENLAAARKED